MCEGQVFDVGALQVRAKYKPAVQLKQVNAIYNVGKAGINRGVRGRADELAAAIKTNISQAPVPAGSSKSYQRLKEWAAGGIGVVTYATQRTRRKIYRGSKIPVNLVSTSPGGKRSAFANSMIEFGRGRLPGRHAWLVSLIQAGGQVNQKNNATRSSR